MRVLKLIDGNSIMFRAYYATAYGNKELLKTSSGQYTNALFAFINMLDSIVDADTTDCLVAFDTKEKTERHHMYADYKAGRKAMPEELSLQVDAIKEYVRLKGIKISIVSGYEADDIIGTTAINADKIGLKTEIYSSDRDLLQLVSDNVTVHLLKSGMKELDDYTPDSLFAKYGLKANQMIDLKALMGDQSDNIKGVPGIGEKTAVKLLQEYQTLDNIYAHVEEISGKNKERLIANKNSAYLSQFLATINLQVPFEYELDDLKLSPASISDIIAFFEHYELNTFLKKYQKNQETKKDIVYQEITDYQTLSAVLKPNMAVYLELSEANYHKASIWGFSLSDGINNYFVDSNIALSSIDFAVYLSDPKIAKYTYDYKALIGALKWQKLVVKGVTFDLLLAAYLANSRLGKEDFTTITTAFAYYDLASDDDIYGKGAKRALGNKCDYAKHIAAKALAIYQLKDTVINELKAKEQYELLTNLEIPLSEVLADMEYTGFKVDLKELHHQKINLEKRIAKLQTKIYQLAGEEFNIASPKQLGNILFEKLALPFGKKTKTGYSTNIEVLVMLQGSHPIIDKLMEFRQITKLYSTYIEGLKQALFSDDKVHTIFMQALTTTGRLSSIEPNLQNIPIRTNEGKEIRKIFIPSSNDNYLVSSDYSQIELRILADIANVKGLIEAFNNHEDIHTKTAAKVFLVDEVSSEQRRRAKAVNFGIIYGIGAKSLSEDINVSYKEAQAFIDRYLEVFSEIKDYMQETIAFCKEHGYVETKLKRRRYIPEIKAANFNERKFGERTALNARIQGTAADIIKLAMIELYRYIEKNKLKSRLLLQVHDELVLEVPKDELDILKVALPHIMMNAFKLKVELSSSLDYGHTWYELD